MPRRRLPRCNKHTDASSAASSHCAACAALRGKEPTRRKAGSTGAERGHPERRRVAASMTHEEAVAVAALQRLAKRWPASLWLYSASGSLHVMKVGADGQPVMRAGQEGVDPAYIMASIDGIFNDGGDW